MPRIAGIDLQLNKRVDIALSKIYGIAGTINLAFNMWAMATNAITGKGYTVMESTLGRYFNKQDFALLLTRNKKVPYAHSVRLCDFIEEMYIKYKKRASIEYITDLLTKIINVCIKYMKRYGWEHPDLVSKTTLFYAKLYMLNFENLPLVISNYDRIFSK